jgi:ABC-type antimicrobial peptide transport system permease subunit
VETVRREVRGADSSLAVRVMTMSDYMDIELEPRSRAASVLGAISGLGLVLSSVGLYGVISFSVRERAREFGLRMALGARAAEVRRMVLWRGLRLVIVGFAVGLALSIAANRILVSFLSGITGQDPITFGLVALVLAGVALGASYLPARWATRVDPMVALRAD